MSLGSDNYILRCDDGDDRHYEAMDIQSLGDDGNNSYGELREYENIPKAFMKAFDYDDYD